MHVKLTRETKLEIQIARIYPYHDAQQITTGNKREIQIARIHPITMHVNLTRETKR